MDRRPEVFVFESQHDVLLGEIFVFALGYGDCREFIGLIVAGFCEFLFVVSAEAAREVFASVEALRGFVN